MSILMPCKAIGTVYETMRTDLFKHSLDRKGYSQLKIAKDKIKSTIFSHPEFTAYSKKVNTVFTNWKNDNST
jgi:type I restriction enzyme M protein